MIRKLALAALPLFLSSCEVLSYRDSAVLIKGYVLGYEEDKISQATYDEISASFANVKIGRGNHLQLFWHMLREIFMNGDLRTMLLFILRKELFQRLRG